MSRYQNCTKNKIFIFCYMFFVVAACVFCVYFMNLKKDTIDVFYCNKETGRVYVKIKKDDGTIKDLSVLTNKKEYIYCVN